MHNQINLILPSLKPDLKILSVDRHFSYVQEYNFMFIICMVQ